MWTSWFDFPKIVYPNQVNLIQRRLNKNEIKFTSVSKLFLEALSYNEAFFLSMNPNPAAGLHLILLKMTDVTVVQISAP